DTGKAIVKVKLRKKSDEDYKKQQEALKDDKQARLFLKVTCQGDDKKHKIAFVEHFKLICDPHKWANSEFGKLIGKYKSRNNYNICNKTYYDEKAGKRKSKSVTNLTIVEMTISEIQKKQKAREIFAAGRWQIIPDTLKEVIIGLKLNTNDFFNEEMQDRMFDEYLIKKKRPKIIGYLEGNETVEDAMYECAKEWASVGVEKGKKISKNRIAIGDDSYYKGDGLNKAHITANQIKQALMNSKKNN
ncbi:MAG: hypothetical protein AAF806_32190, partial [Bacteroidota bacterium]